MRRLAIVAIILIVVVLLSASAYVIFFTGDENEPEETDTEAPEIISMTGNTTVAAGQAVTISTSFSDNVNVTEATLYYRKAGSTSWTSISILSGSASLTIPSSATEDWYYYVTVDDAAGNGPVGDPSVDGSIYYTINVTYSDGGNGGGDDENITHYVFIEEATATWCNNCPAVANILHTLYESHLYNFYYVSLVEDKNTIAHDRLYTDYNIYGFPTVYLDGGYSVIVGAKAESVFADAVTAAQSRVVPKIQVTVTAEYKNTTDELTVTAQVENKENTSYTGRLKIYLTEIISQWNGYDSKPYHFSFLDYVFNEDITIAANKNDSFSETQNISAYDYENLMIIAVVFGSEKHTGYSQPPDETDQFPFDAYFADATDATKIVEGGNLPPQLEITSPQRGTMYLNGNPFLVRLQQRKLIGYLLNMSLHNTTVLLGQKTVTVAASDDSAVVNVEFYVDGELYSNDTQAPYEWSFKKLSTLKSLFFREHTLEVIVYDDTGKTSSASLVFKARI